MFGSGPAGHAAAECRPRAQLEPLDLRAVAEPPGAARDEIGIEERAVVTSSTEGDAETGEQAGRRQCAALVFELIGGYIAEDAHWVARVIRQVGLSGRVSEVLAEATRFTAYLTAEARAAGARLKGEQIRTGVLSRLAATVPPHHELAVSNALDALFEGRFRTAAAEFGEGSDGDLIALHALAAFAAMLGTHVSAPGEFTSAILTAFASVMHSRG